MDQKELLEKRKLHWEAMKRIVDTAKMESRNLSSKECNDYDFHETRLDSIDKEIDGVDMTNKFAETRGAGSEGPTEEDRAFTHYLRTADASRLYAVRADGTGFSTAPNSAGLTGGSTGDYGGYMVPQGFWRNLQIAEKAFGGIAGDFRLVETDTGAPMPWPTIDPTAITASWLGASSELTQQSIEDGYSVGQGMLNAWTAMYGPILVSLQLIQDNAFDVDGLLASLLGEAIGRTVSAAAVSGTGSGQPEGIITALNAKGAVGSGSGGYYGLGTATSVATFGGSTSELTGNVLAPETVIKVVQSVDPAYYPNAKWYMSAAQAFNMHSVVDTNNRPLLSFMNGFEVTGDTRNPDYSSAGAVAQLLGFPVVIDNNLPALTASTTGGPVFGDLSRAMVYRRVRQGVNVMRLTERYADYLAVGFIAWARLDLRSNDMRAAVTVKPAAT